MSEEILFFRKQRKDKGRKRGPQDGTPEGKKTLGTKIGGLAKKAAVLGGTAIAIPVAKQVGTKVVGHVSSKVAPLALRAIDKATPQALKDKIASAQKALGSGVGGMAESGSREAARRVTRGAVGGALIGAGQGVGDAVAAPVKALGRAGKGFVESEKKKGTFQLRMTDKEKAVVGKIKGAFSRRKK